MSYMGTIWYDLATDWNTNKRDTQKEVSKTNHLIIFSFYLFSDPPNHTLISAAYPEGCLLGLNRTHQC